VYQRVSYFECNGDKPLENSFERKGFRYIYTAGIDTGEFQFKRILSWDGKAVGRTSK